MKPQWRELLALGSAYSLATAVFNIAPLLIGMLISVVGLMEAQAGLLMTLELVAMSVVAFVLAPWGSRFSNKTVLVLCVVLALATNALAATNISFEALVSLRILAGVSGGFLLLAVNTRIAAHAEPVRLYGLVVVATTVVGAMLLALIPALVLSFGIAGAYGTLAVLCAIVVPLVAMIPALQTDEASTLLDDKVPLSISRLQIVMLLSAVFMIQFAQSGFYSFSERFGVESIGLSTEEMGVLLAIGYLGAIPGSALAAWLGYRFGRISPLLLSLLVFALTVNVAVFADHRLVFSAAFIALNFSYFFSIPYQLGIAADLDHTGKLASASIGVFFFGLAGGPYLGGFLVSNFDYASLAISINFAVAIGMVIYVWIQRHSDIVQT